MDVRLSERLKYRELFEGKRRMYDVRLMNHVRRSSELNV